MNFIIHVRRCLLAVAAGWILAAWAVPATFAAENLFGNPSFENGRDEWHLDCSGKTAAEFTVDEKEAAAGQRSAAIRMGAVDGWGVQFGQMMEAPERGKTYTFAVLAKSVKGPVALRLEIERHGDPYDRAAAGPPQTVTSDKWTELHVTFKIEKSFPQGWFAYVSCNQPDAEFRLDMFRLVEGEYVPYEKAAREEIAAAAVTLFDSVQASPVPLAGKAIRGRKGWTQVPEDATDHRFRGDAVLMNDRLALVLRRGAAGAELYGHGPAGPRPPRGARARGRPTGRKTAGGGRRGQRSQPGGRGCHVPIAAAAANSRFAMSWRWGRLSSRPKPRDGRRGLSVEAPAGSWSFPTSSPTTS